LSEIYAAFRKAAAHHDVARASKYLADDVRLFASLTSKPFEGKQAVLAVFTMLLEVIEDLTYVAEYDSPGGKVILTRGKINGREVDGVQVLTLRSDGLISEFRDFIRPFSGAVALREAAERYFQRTR
jgi:hypothetical protein